MGWKCSSCTFINEAFIQICEMCDEPKPTKKYLSEEEYDIAGYKHTLTCAKTHVRMAEVFDPSIVSTLKTGHIRMLYSHGVCPLKFMIRDEDKNILCPIGNGEIVSLFDEKFSVLRLCDDDQLNVIYPLLVIQHEVRKDMMRTLAVCDLCKSVIMRNYLPTITDYLYGEAVAKANDIFDYQIRKQYVHENMRLIHTNKQSEIKNFDFLIYWLQKYCICDTQFLKFYMQFHNSETLKTYCKKNRDLRALLYRFDKIDLDDEQEKYNSFHL